MYKNLGLPVKFPILYPDLKQIWFLWTDFNKRVL